MLALLDRAPRLEGIGSYVCYSPPSVAPLSSFLLFLFSLLFICYIILVFAHFLFPFGPPPSAGFFGYFVILDLHSISICYPVTYTHDSLPCPYSPLCKYYSVLCLPRCLVIRIVFLVFHYLCPIVYITYDNLMTCITFPVSQKQEGLP